MRVFVFKNSGREIDRMSELVTRNFLKGTGLLYSLRRHSNDVSTQ